MEMNMKMKMRMWMQMWMMRNDKELHVVTIPRHITTTTSIPISTLGTYVRIKGFTPIHSTPIQYTEHSPRYLGIQGSNIGS